MSSRRPQLSRSIAAVATLLALIAGVLAAGGCEQEDPNSCAYWVKRLKNAATTQEALLQIGEMKCTDGLADMKKMFEEGQFQDEVMTAVSRIGDKAAAAEVFARAARIPALGAKAANLIGEMKLIEAKPALVEILTKPRNLEARGAALEALLLIDEPKNNEDILIEVLKDDPAIQGLKVNAKAAEALGKMRSAKAVEPLINAMFVRTANKQEIYAPVRKALARIGTPAVEPLIKAINGELESLNKFVKAKNIPRWRWQLGPKLAQVLGDLRDAEGSVAITKNMAEDLVRPEGMTEATMEEWRQNQTNRLVMGMIGLGQIGSDKPAEALGKLIPNQGERDTSQRLNSATALAFVGSDASLKSLFAAYDAEKDYRFRAAMLLPLTMGLDNDPARMKVWDDIQEYIKLRPKQKELYFEQFVLKEQLEDKDVGPRLAAYVNTVKACKADTTCYQEKLKAEDLSTRMKAVLMLNRQPQSDSIFDALMEAYKTSERDEIDYRRFILMGLGRHGSKGKAAVIENFVENLREKGKKEAYWAEEFELLSFALGRKAG